MKRVATSLVAAAALTVSALPAVATQQVQNAPPPAFERYVDVGGYNLYIHCLGSGSPTVVINGGAGTWSLRYRPIQQALASETRVCTLDPAGLGESESGPGPRTSSREADELHLLLHGAGIGPPYILVGHSFGGLVSRIYQRRHSDEVSGVVLVDSAHPEQWERLPPQALAAVNGRIPYLEALADRARAGALQDTDIGPGRFASADLEASYQSAMRKPQTYEAMADLFRNIGLSMLAVPEGDMGDVPLVVVSAGRSFDIFEGLGIPTAEANQIWSELQSELVGLSRNSIHIVSEAGTHDLDLSDPETVLRGIVQAVNLVREGAEGRPGGGVHPTHRLSHTSDPATDAILLEIEEVYRSMDVTDLVGLFSEDFEQLDVNRRVLRRGRDEWRTQIERINGAHLWMERLHHGRLRVGDVVVVELEWAGLVRGEAFAPGSPDRPYRYTGLGIVELDEAGRVSSQVLFGDFVTLAEQLSLPNPTW